MTVSSYQIGKRDLGIIALIVLCALFLRAWYLYDYKNTPAYPVLPYSDSYSYFIWAKDIAHGDVLGARAFMKWPLYAYLVGLTFKLYGSSITLIYILQFVFGAISCILVYLIGTLLFNRRAGLIAACCCLGYGLFLFYDAMLIYTSISLFLNSFLFLFLLYAREHPNRKTLFLAGILLGLCTVTQANIAIFGMLAVAWILWQARKDSLRNGALFLIGWMCIVGIVTIRNYIVEKDFVLIAGNIGLNFYSGNNPHAPGTFYCPTDITLNQDDMFRDSRIIAEASAGRRLKTSEVSRYWLDKSLDFIKRNPRDYLELLGKKIALVFGPKEHIHEMEYYLAADTPRVLKLLFKNLWFILPLALLGMAINIKRFKEYALLYFIVIALSLSIALFFVSTRYRMAVVPFLAIFAGSALSCIWDAAMQKEKRRLFLLSLAFLLIFVLLNNSITPALQSKQQVSNEVDIFEYHLSKASVFERVGRYRDALRDLDEAAKVNAESKRLLFRQGVIYYSLGDMKGAEEKFKAVISRCSLCVDGYYNLGFLYNQEGRFKEAGMLLERAVLLNPEDAGGHFELGRTYKALNEPGKAKTELLSALRIISRWRKDDRARIEQELKGL